MHYIPSATGCIEGFELHVLSSLFFCLLRCSALGFAAEMHLAVLCYQI